MREPISLAIETSCRLGGAALGAGDEIIARADFDASSRHATQLVGRLAELLGSHGLRPADLHEVYVSVGPGSFTGTRIAVTVARMLAQMLPRLHCVAVPTPAAVAEAARQMDWRHLAVVLDAREGLAHVSTFRRDAGEAGPCEPSGVMAPREFLAACPRPIVLLGEGLGYHDLSGDGITIPHPEATDSPPHLPLAENVWRVGRRMARAGRFTEVAHLLPVYSRPPEAVRAWEKTHGPGGV